MIALAIFAALQVADVTLTTLILRRGGRELNPAMRWLMDKLGTVPGLALPKVVLIGVFCAVMNYPGADTAIAIASVLYAGVVAWNLKEFLK